MLTWILISHAENFAAMNRSDDGATAAIVGNPSGPDFEMVRTDLLPGLLKTLSSNKASPAQGALGASRRPFAPPP